jgi:tRNA threonylcarbamoyladenosine biosynthesis protein TsaB
VIVLAIDTALGACQAAVQDGAKTLAIRSEAMQRGHQERLAPLVREVMAEAGVGFPELERIGVTVGPGSFTGVRVGLAFAKGLALALDIPAIGVGALEALAAGAPAAGAVSAVIDARRDEVYLQSFRGGGALDGPEALTVASARGRLASLGPQRLVGSGAALFEDLDGMVIDPVAAPDPRIIAALAARAEGGPLKPLYLRAPDARLPA